MQVLASIADGLLPTDEAALVVFGSLARAEFTVGSDLDWTILIDGRADSRHLEIVHELKHKLADAGFKVPGPTGTFGGLVFSHELIHTIGGDEDTNKNMTRRLLLLLESAAVAVAGSDSVRDRIILGILDRYVEEDASFLPLHDPSKKIPRFLLNDVVRFWRTMAVDYASKYRERAAEKWGLRNIKLRMSRKLLFISGLFMCLSWKLAHRNPIEESPAHQLVSHLQSWIQRTPLESLAMIVEQYAPAVAADVFDSYDSFLQLLSDGRQREALERLSPEDAYQDQSFTTARDLSKVFDTALINVLFESNVDVTQLVKQYGVF